MGRCAFGRQAVEKYGSTGAKQRAQLASSRSRRHEAIMITRL